MTDEELRRVLCDRLRAVEYRVVEACQRAGRPRYSVVILAITKTVSVRVAEILPGLGIGALGENRPQELWKKAAAITGANWHFTGHLQRNKIDRTLPLIELIHTVDSERLALAIGLAAQKRGRVMPVLLEVNCSGESTKGGFAPSDLPAVADRLKPIAGLQIQGLMTMAAHGDAPENSRAAFAELRHLRDRYLEPFGQSPPILSMGMSGDFEVAIEEGATYIRLGTVLFEGLEGE